MMGMWQPSHPEANRLHAARRNRYYFGKLLTADNLATEQDYVREQLQLRTRLMSGPGVLCGLDVTAVQQNGTWGVEISPELPSTRPAG